eukprot:6202669-Pleurochrysis_carterae.AAC.1
MAHMQHTPSAPTQRRHAAHAAHKCSTRRAHALCMRSAFAHRTCSMDQHKHMHERRAQRRDDDTGPPHDDDTARPHASSGRYHVYVGNACPWCHRVLIALKLRGLLGKVSFTRLIDDPEKASRGGWAFAPTAPDPLCNAPDLRGVYNRCTPGGTYTGRCTAPLLVDLATSRIISNESGDIVRMLNDLDIMTADLNSDKAVDLYPEHLRDEIDRTNAWVSLKNANKPLCPPT